MSTMPSRSKQIVVSVLAVVFGAALWAALWAALVHVSGKREAWDSGLYWRVGLPVCYAASGIFGYLEPHCAWRWGLLPFVGQFVWMLVSEGVGSLMPLGAIAMGVLALPGVLLAIVGAALARKKR